MRRAILFAVFFCLSSIQTLVQGEESGDPPSPARVLVVTGANNHDWPWTSAQLVSMLRSSGKFRVERTTSPGEDLAKDGLIDRFDALVLDYNGPRWGRAAEGQFVRAVRGGVGVVVLHAANNAFPGWREYEEIVGHLWREGTGHGRFHPFDVVIRDRDHPVTEGMADWLGHPDELYHRLVAAPGAERKRILAYAFSDPRTGGSGRLELMMTAGTYGRGRVFHTPLGHVWPGVEETRASYRDARFRDLVVRATEWAATGRVTPEATPPNALSEDERRAGFRLLFDGSSLEGWRGWRSEKPPEGWSVADGAIVVRDGGAGGDLTSVEKFGDFELRFQWLVTPKANSGVMVRADEAGEQSYFSGPEYQILDDFGHHLPADAPNCAAALYALAHPRRDKVLRLAGHWNTGRIVVRGSRITHFLNGFETCSLDLASPEGRERIAKSKFRQWPIFASARRGHIVLQDHGDEVRYRSIRIREFDALPERDLLAGGLEGWRWVPAEEGSRLEDVWSFADGVLSCRGRPIGYLRTEETFEDFHLSLEWRFPADPGNSGVLLRRTGEDKVWPHSLEAQLHSGDAGDIWLIDGFRADVAADRTEGRRTRRAAGEERPLGEWNRYDIYADGGTITLVVNGVVANVARNCEDVAGHLCLQSEGAPIEFRNIRLRPLPDADEARAPGG